MTTTIDNAKEKVQQEAFNKWKEFKRGVLQLCTGSGKTRIGVMCTKYILDIIPNAKILITTPTETIRDKVMPQEFKKWGYNNLLKKIEIQCIQSAWKRCNEQFDFIWLDEYHHTFSICHILIFNNKIKYLLGTTAYIPPEDREQSDKIAPTIYNLSIQKAVNEGIISPFNEWNVPVYMTSQEKEKFNLISEKYNKLEQILGGSQYAFINARTALSKGAVSNNFLNALHYMRILNERKNILYNIDSKVKLASDLIDILDDKVIVFFQSIEAAEMLYCTRNQQDDTLVFHSKIKKQDRKDILKRFEKSKYIKVLSVVSALNEGLDVPKVKYGIIAASTSTRRTHIQRMGRIIRYQENKIGNIFNLYVPGTQDEVWLRRRQYLGNVSQIKWINNLSEIII